MLIIDFQYEYAIPIRSNPRELPSIIDHETIYSQRLTPIEFEIPRGVLIQRRKKKKKNVTRAKKTRGCNDYPLQALHVYRYAYIHTKRTVRWNPLSVRIYTMLDEKKRTVGLPCCAQRNVKILPRASDLNDAAGICARSKSYACVIG